MPQRWPLRCTSSLRSLRRDDSVQGGGLRDALAADMQTDWADGLGFAPPPNGSIVSRTSAQVDEKVMRFEWDPKKAAANLKKHGVSFKEAATAFGDPLSLTKFDPDHSAEDEDRFILLGATHAGRLVIVSHTDRGEIVRIISARVATRRERRSYASS